MQHSILAYDCNQWWFFCTFNCSLVCFFVIRLSLGSIVCFFVICLSGGEYAAMLLMPWILNEKMLSCSNERKLDHKLNSNPKLRNVSHNLSNYNIKYKKRENKLFTYYVQVTAIDLELKTQNKLVIWATQCNSLIQL